jgi:Rieske Fe-S protein
MWSTSVGAEVMKPLATPVLGGMISSLLHVLIVTPVIFFAIRERQLGVQHQSIAPGGTATSIRRRTVIASVIVIAVIAAAFAAWRWSQTTGPDAGTDSSRGSVVQVVPAGDVSLTLLTPAGTLKTGRNVVTLEFRSRAGELLDVGTVRVTANMTMPGMVMAGNVEVRRTRVAGRYAMTAEFRMGGNWPFRVEWDGPAGRGSVSFEGAVQ